MNDDLISRQAAIEWVKTECNPYGKPTLEFESGKKVIEHLKQMSPAQSERQWIPVSERLPEKYIGQWLCYTSDGDIMILPYDTPGDGTKKCVFHKWDDDGYFYQTYNVIAWMPLPEPYKEEKNDAKIH